MCGYAFYLFLQKIAFLRAEVSIAPLEHLAALMVENHPVQQLANGFPCAPGFRLQVCQILLSQLQTIEQQRMDECRHGLLLLGSDHIEQFFVFPGDAHVRQLACGFSWHRTLLMVRISASRTIVDAGPGIVHNRQ